MTTTITAKDLKSFVAKQNGISPGAKHAFVSMTDEKLDEMLGYHLGLVKTIDVGTSSLWTLAHLCRPSNIVSRHDTEDYEWYLVDELIAVPILIVEDVDYATGEQATETFEILGRNLTISEMNNRFTEEVDFYRTKWEGSPAGVIITLASLEVPRNLMDGFGIEGGDKALMQWINRGNTDPKVMCLIRNIAL